MNHPTESEAPVAAATRQRSPQRLWPLFGVALILMALGYYLAITHQHDPDRSDAPPPKFTALVPLDVSQKLIDTSDGALTLRHRTHQDNKYRLLLRQASRDERPGSKPSTLTTHIELGVHDGVTDAQAGRFERKGVLAITRHYDHAKADVVDGKGEHIGAGITSQVEDLVRGSVTRSYVAANGEPVDFEWRAVPNPQARRMLFLVRDAQTFLTPRFFSGAVNPGDTWSYKRPLTVDSKKLGVKADGQVTIEDRFVGTVTIDKRKVAVIRQTLHGKVSGRLDTDKANAAFDLTGDGKGVELVNVHNGSVYAADINFQRKLTVRSHAGKAKASAPIVQTSDIFMGIRPDGGVALPSVSPSNGGADHGRKLEAAKEASKTE